MTYQHTPEEIRSLLRILAAAGLRPRWGYDDADALELWASTLGPFSQAALLEATREWIATPSAGFPTLSQLAQVAGVHQRRSDAAARSQRASCPECFGERWVWTSDPTGPSTPTVRPCSLCSPEPYKRWSAGIYSRARSEDHEMDAEPAREWSSLAKAQLPAEDEPW